MNNNQDFWQIGSDGGLLESPVKMNKLVLGPAERAEIIIDFAKFKKNDVVFLQDQDTKLMKFIVNGEKKNNEKLPEKLAVLPKIDPKTAIKTREFVFQGMGPMVNINGKQMDLDRIDEELKLNSTEIWEISNESMGMMGGRRHSTSISRTWSTVSNSRTKWISASGERNWLERYNPRLSR